MTATAPYRPQTERESSVWYRLEPEAREALNLAWLALIRLARISARRMGR